MGWSSRRDGGNGMEVITGGPRLGARTLRASSRSRRTPGRPIIPVPSVTPMGGFVTGSIGVMVGASDKQVVTSIVSCGSLHWHL